MLRPVVIVAWPHDLLGRAVRAGAVLVFLLLLVPVLLARLPWDIDRNPMQGIAVRACITLVLAWLLLQLRALAGAALPHAPRLSRRTLRVAGRGKPVFIPLDEVHSLRTVFGQTVLHRRLQVVTAEGVYDVCPLSWVGAPRLFIMLHRRVRSLQRKRARKARRAAARG